MTIAGAAPKIAIPTFIYMFITIYIDEVNKPTFNITERYYPVLVSAAVLMIIIGIAMVISVSMKLQKSYKAGILMTDGLYRYFRNPMYAAYLLFVIPGICLLFNSWLVLTTVIVNFILFQVFIKMEYRYLEEKFGEDYQAYLKNVWFKYL